MTIASFLTLAMLALAPFSVHSPTFAQQASGANPDLAGYVGAWETKYQDQDGDNKQIWTFEWNVKKTYLDLRTLTYLNDEVIFVGDGFVFYAKPDSEYRIYLMMDNSVLHESIGAKVGESKFLFTSKTYGNPNFPDVQTEISLSPDTMNVTYISKEPDGSLHRDENLFRRVRSTND